MSNPEISAYFGLFYGEPAPLSAFNSLREIVIELLEEERFVAQYTFRGNSVAEDIYPISAAKEIIIFNPRRQEKFKEIKIPESPEECIKLFLSLEEETERQRKEAMKYIIQKGLVNILEKSTSNRAP